MRIYLALALGGIPLGAMYALQALGIVLVYKTSKVFNFAAGAIGLASAYVASALVVGQGVPDVVAAIVGVAAGASIGALMELVTIRGVRGALPRTIVTLGWLLALQGVVGAVFGTQQGRQPALPLPQGRAFGIGGLSLQFGQDQVVVVVLAVLLAAGLALFFRSAAIGTATRAVADDPVAARLLGIRVDRVTLLAWTMGGALSGLSGVLVTPLINKLDTIALVIFTIQALAAALVGRLSSLPLTVAGGVGLGMLQPVVRYALRAQQLQGTDELTALLVVLVALLAFRRTGRRDSGTGGLLARPVPPLPVGRQALLAFAGVLAAAVAAPPIAALLGTAGSSDVAQVAIWSLAVLSLVLLVGVVGQVSLCQAVFMGVGAFGAAVAVGHGVPFVAALAVGGLLAAGTALLVGVPAIRLEPLELAIATLSLSFAADRFLYHWPPLVGSGSSRVLPRPGFANQDPGHALAGDRAYAWLALALFLVAAFAVASLRRGRTGAALAALRSSEPATAAMGFSVVSVKLRGFAAAGFLAGVAGGLFGGLYQTASGNVFDVTRSISLLAYAVIIGVGSVPGALVGGVVVTLSTLSFGASDSVQTGFGPSLVTAITGVALMVVLRLSPDGLSGLVPARRTAA